MYTSFLCASSRKKSNRTGGETGNHTDETAHKITPVGSLGSFKFFLEETLMSSPVLLVTLFHVWKLDAPIARQKLQVILCASFRMLFLPAKVATPTLQQQIYLKKLPYIYIFLSQWEIFNYQLNLLWEHWLPWRIQFVHTGAAMLLPNALHQKQDHCSQWFCTLYELCFSGTPRARPMSPEKIIINLYNFKHDCCCLSTHKCCLSSLHINVPCSDHWTCPELSSQRGVFCTWQGRHQYYLLLCRQKHQQLPISLRWFAWNIGQNKFLLWAPLVLAFAPLQTSATSLFLTTHHYIK